MSRSLFRCFLRIIGREMRRAKSGRVDSSYFGGGKDREMGCEADRPLILSLGRTGGSTFFSLFIAKPDHMQMTTCILSILRYTKPSRFPPSSICPLRHIYYSRRQRYSFDMYMTTRLSSATAFTAALSSTSSHCSRHLTMNNLIAIQASHPVSVSPILHTTAHYILLRQ